MCDFKGQQDTINVTEDSLKTLKPNSELSLSEEYKKCNAQQFIQEAKKYRQTQPKALYDADIVQEIIRQSNRFKNLKPAALLAIIGEPRKYDYLKKVAVAHLEKMLQKQLVLFSQIMETKEDDQAIQTENLTHGVFSWKWSDFLERRKQKNFLWVDILLRKHEDDLHRTKVKYDIKELKFFVNQILHGFVLHSEKKEVGVCQRIEKSINETKKALCTLDNIEKEYYANVKELQYIYYKEYLFTDAKRHSEEKMLKIYLENRILNSHILDPIEIRYQLNWVDSVAKQNQYSIEKATNTYQADTSRFKEMESMESFINGNWLDYCYSSIELYKNQLNEFQNKYDRQVDEMDTKLALLRLQIDKIKEQRSWLASEIQRFKDEENELRVQEEINKKQGMNDN